MTDMLVKLYDLPDYYPAAQALLAQGIEIRRPYPFEKSTLIPWVRSTFSDIWAEECAGVLNRDPINCYIAIEKQPIPEPDDNPYNLPPEKITGFACFNAARKGVFGPTGVRDDYRGRGIGKGLLLACLHEMWRQNYAYAIIWYVGPAEFYAKTVGAVPIAGSQPGFYRGSLTG